MVNCRLTHFGQPLQLIETVRPIPAGKEVLLKIETCRVCHSDLNLLDGFFDLGAGKRFDKQT